LGDRRRQRAVIGGACLGLALLCIVGLAQAGEGDEMATKRRQQGILTGMPFMANLASRTFVDDLDRKLYLAKPPTRIVSLAPSVTEILFAIGLDQEIVGVTPFCDYPPQAQGKPKVGYVQPNLEALVALRPDLVLAPREFLRADILSKLEQLKISIFVLDAKTLDDIPSHIQTIGRMVERGPAADRLATDLRRQVAEIKRRVSDLPRPRLLYVLHSQPLITVGPGSFIHQLIDLAGATNVAGRAKVPYPRLNMEEVLKEDPEVLVFPQGKTEGVPQSEQDLWRRWSAMTAVKQGRLHQVPSDLLNRPGPRIVQGLEALARVVHPEAFDKGEAP
jgi:iron complex transport system substrate-binding protein